MTGALPTSLQTIKDDFLDLGVKDRLQLLLEFSNELPELPERYQNHPDLFERVEECQSPVFIFVEIDADSVVHLWATAPKEAPTTRGFASILVQGLAGLTVDEVLAVGASWEITLDDAARHALLLSDQVSQCGGDEKAALGHVNPVLVIGAGAWHKVCEPVESGRIGLVSKLGCPRAVPVKSGFF